MISLAKPNIPQEAIDNVIKVLRSGNLVQGKHVAEFERKLEKYLDVKHVIAVSSGTAALHLSLIALGIKQGDEVIVPAFSFPATANVVELVGAKTVLVDISLDDFCIDTSKIEDAITNNTKVIMPVHEFGQSAKMDDLLRIANQYNLRIVEDAACGLGAEFNNQKVGTFGDCGCFSFHPRKAITTGEGGVIVTDDDALANRVSSLRNHGIEIVNNKQEFNFPGYNYRMTDFQAALGIPQLAIIEKLINQRINIAQEYNRLLLDTGWINQPKTINGRRHVYQTYHTTVKADMDRDMIMQYLSNNKVQTNYGADAINLLTYFKKKYNSNKKYINATTSFANGLALPIGSHITKKQVSEIVQVLKRFI